MSSSEKQAKTYSVFGAGGAGLYTLWRLLDGVGKDGKAGPRQPAAGDTLELLDWGRYAFSKEHPGTREPGARVCTWHYQGDSDSSYLELGGMRYSKWDSKAKDANSGTASGHRVVTTVVEKLGLDQYSVPFNESANPLYYLRTKNLYYTDFSSTDPAPYNADHYGAATNPYTAFSIVDDIAVPQNSSWTRAQWDDFYQHGRVTAEMPASSVFQKGDLLKDIGYWNLMYDQLGSEGYNYSADGNGYTSNVINWNSAVAFESNFEFTPGNSYNTLTTGYSGMFTALFHEIVRLAAAKGVVFHYYPDTRLHSILKKDGKIHYTYATREKPWDEAGARVTDAAWLAMPRHALELVAQASRYSRKGGLDVLNDQQVRLYLEAAIMQPSYKVGMFFDSPWWEKAVYAPKLEAYIVTPAVIAQLEKDGFPPDCLKALEAIAGQQFSSAPALVEGLEAHLTRRLTLQEERQLKAAALRNTMGPSVTDTPIRQVVYFGNNANDRSRPPIYGLLASYDDETFTTFWQELELGPHQQRRIPISEDDQPLQGPRKVPSKMVKMLRKQLAEIHFGPGSDYANVPEPKEAAYMDWSLPPFNAGYHAWTAHYDIADVQQKIRKPSQMISGADAEIFIVGEAYSNDQAWVEGAYCTAESVLNDFFDVQPISDNTHYPFICRVVKETEPLAQAAGAE